MNIVVLTGAGISVSAGLRPYRGPGGIWQEQRVEDLSTAAAFAANPARCAEFWGGMAQGVAQAVPTPAHQALAALEARHKVTIITQNVDGLHQAAGSTAVIELHGSMRRWRCGGCEAAGTELLVEYRQCACGGWQRPDVVLFDEPLPSFAFSAARRRAEAAQLFICVGTSLLVRPAADLPDVAAAAEARTVYVGRDLPPRPGLWSEIRIERADDALPKMVAALLAGS